MGARGPRCSVLLGVPGSNAGFSQPDEFVSLGLIFLGAGLEDADLLEVGQAGLVLGADLGQIVAESGASAVLVVLGVLLDLLTQFEEEVFGGLVQAVPGHRACGFFSLWSCGCFHLGGCFVVDLVGEVGDRAIHSGALALPGDGPFSRDLQAAIGERCLVAFGDFDATFHDAEGLVECSRHLKKRRALCP